MLCVTNDNRALNPRVNIGRGKSWKAGDLFPAITGDPHLIDGLKCITEHSGNRIIGVRHEFAVALRFRRSASQYFGQRLVGVFCHRVTAHKRWHQLTISWSGDR